MIQIPLPFVLTAIALVLLWVEWDRSVPGERNRYLIGFMSLFAVQTMIIGLRFGYGLDQLTAVQPVTAAVLPPLGYLAFCAPQRRGKPWIILASLVLVLLILTVAPQLIDATLAMLNLGFGAALMRIGVQGDSAVAWVGVNALRRTRAMLWGIAALFLLSGVSDALISVDACRTQGAHTGTIAAAATALFLALVAAVAFRARPRPKPGPPAAEIENLAETFARVEACIADPRLFTDPDLTLNRIARKLGLPAREVSQAINRQAGMNLSHYVNSVRIAEACRLLKDTDLSITEIQFQVGFNTKSNFHRAFNRITQMTPSQWQKQAQASGSG